MQDMWSAVLSTMRTKYLLEEKEICHLGDDQGIMGWY